MQEKNSSATKDSSVLFSCPNEGCVKVYERYSSLEKHMSFGKCRMLPEKETLLDKAKTTYHALLQEDVSTAKTLRGTSEVETTDGTSLPEGWALKTAKKSTRFRDLMNLKRSTWRKSSTLDNKQVTSKTPSKLPEICALQRKQMGQGCSPATSSLLRSRYSLSFQEWRLSFTTL